MLKVGAGSCLVSIAFDILPSFLPFGTSHVGPPDYNRIDQTKYLGESFIRVKKKKKTSFNLDYEIERH